MVWSKMSGVSKLYTAQELGGTHHGALDRRKATAACRRATRYMGAWLHGTRENMLMTSVILWRENPALQVVFMKKLLLSWEYLMFHVVVSFSNKGLAPNLSVQVQLIESFPHHSERPSLSDPTLIESVSSTQRPSVDEAADPVPAHPCFPEKLEDLRVPQAEPSIPLSEPPLRLVDSPKSATSYRKSMSSKRSSAISASSKGISHISHLLASSTEGDRYWMLGWFTRYLSFLRVNDFLYFSEFSYPLETKPEPSRPILQTIANRSQASLVWLHREHLSRLGPAELHHHDVAAGAGGPTGRSQDSCKCSKCEKTSRMLNDMMKG